MGIFRNFRRIRYWRDYIQFHEYFHGDTGAGIGASHQTGWTGTIARTMQLFAQMSMEDSLNLGKASALKGTKGPFSLRRNIKVRRRKTEDGSNHMSQTVLRTSVFGLRSPDFGL